MLLKQGAGGGEGEGWEMPGVRRQLVVAEDEGRSEQLRQGECGGTGNEAGAVRQAQG